MAAQPVVMSGPHAVKTFPTGVLGVTAQTLTSFSSPVF